MPSDTRRLWVPEPASGRPYLGLIGHVPPRMLAAEPEVQPMIVAPPRVGIDNKPGDFEYVKIADA